MVHLLSKQRCQGAAGDESDQRNDGQRALAAVQDAWNAAALRWDLDAFAAVYTGDALFFGGRPGQSVGRDAVRKYFASYVGVIDSATLALVDQHVVRLVPGTFLAQGFGQLQLRLSNGKLSQTVLRTTLIVVQREGRWEIQQHHFSVTPDAPPLGSASSNACC